MSTLQVPNELATWDESSLEKARAMMAMGFHVFNDEWQKPKIGGVGGKRISCSFTDCTLWIHSSGETMTIPVQTCTRVIEVKEWLARVIMIDPLSLTFVTGTGLNRRALLDGQEIGRKVLVQGIETFKPTASTWPHPVAIIGTGYNGIKMAMMYARDGNNNFVAFDRNDKVGGYSWITAANKDSKLEAEMGSYHVWWGPDFAGRQECGGWPSNWEPFPTRKRVLEHFEVAAKEFGLLASIRFMTNVVRMDVVGAESDHGHYYNLMTESTDSGKQENSIVPCSVICSFPGSRTRNRNIEFPGEDDFDGIVCYAMGEEPPYDKVKGTNVAIVGNGAFAVENARTVAEYGCSKVFIISRQKNLVCPRLPCWFVNQAPLPCSGRLLLQMFEPAYTMCGLGEPWNYPAVQGWENADNVDIVQSSKFAIADVTFLMVAAGKLEYVEDTIKRVAPHALHLTSGQKLEDIKVFMKALGLVGNFDIDRLHRMKEMVGFWCGGDYRRSLYADPLGVNTTKFDSLADGLPTWMTLRAQKFLHDYPAEYNRLASEGISKMLPKSTAVEDNEKPVYVINAAHVATVRDVLESMSPKISALSKDIPAYKYELYHKVHPTRKILEACEKEWAGYQAKWNTKTAYPYNMGHIEEWFALYNGEHSEMAAVRADGPTEETLDALRKLGSGGAETESDAQTLWRINKEGRTWWEQEAPNVSQTALFMRQHLPASPNAW